MENPTFTLMPITTPWPGAEPQQNERDYAMFLHLSALSGFVIPFGSLLGPVIMWIIKKDESAFIDAHGKRAIDFHISFLIVAIIGAVLTMVCVGFIILLAAFIVWIIGIVQAVMAAKAGQLYRYPCSFAFLSSGPLASETETPYEAPAQSDDDLPPHNPT